MLINLSNHPSEKWAEKQRKAAKSVYGSILDMPFPQVPPESSMDEVNKMVNDYTNKIMEYQPVAVHIMGELTFTFSLVDQLMNRGISCIASTTQRNVEEEEDGVRKVRFEFVRFREYRKIKTKPKE